MSARKNVTIPAAQLANIVALSKELKQVEDESATRAAKQKAESEALMDRLHHPRKYLADDDILAVNQRIGDVLLSLLSIHQIAGEVFDADVETAALCAVAIKEMSRANIRGLDACVRRLTGGQGFGCFETEFSVD